MKNYHVIVFSWDEGEDDKNDCRTFSEALQWVRHYLADGWEKARIIRRRADNPIGIVAGRFTRLADGTTHCEVQKQYAALL